MTTVDEFVEARVLPQFHPIVAMLRELMRETAPNATEAISYDMPTYTCRRIFAYIIPNKKGITFSFTHGTEFEDKYGLLRGKGKVSRHVTIKNLQAIDKDALRYYIAQALELDAK